MNSAITTKETKRRTKIAWKYFPKNLDAPSPLKDIVALFERNYELISTNEHSYQSNEVLKILTEDLVELGYQVEVGKKDIEKIHRPVLYGENGTYEKCFDVDAYNANYHIAVEVEAGRAVMNYQFLKDFFEACMMVDVDYLCIAVCNTYKYREKGKQKEQHDFDSVCSFFEAMYASRRIDTRLEGIIVIGY